MHRRRWPSVVLLFNFVLVSQASNTLFSRARGSVTLPCTALAGSAEAADVQSLSWVCYGCSASMIVSVDAAVETPLVEVQDQEVSVLQSRGRLSLRRDAAFSLLYEPVEVKDSGEYVCRVNGRRTASASIRLVVQDVPSAPGRPLITNFTSRSVFLSWTGSKANNSPVKHYLIYVKMGEHGRWGRDPIVTPNNHTSFVVENLQPFTAYSFRLAAINAIGTSPNGTASYPIITLREAPGAKPVIVSARNTSATSVRVRWKPLSRADLRGEFQSYIVTYRARGPGQGQAGGADENQPIRELRIQDERVQSHTISGLRPFTQYLISVQVENPAGIGPSSTVVVTTDEGVPEAPREVSVINVTDTSIALRWTAPQHPNGRVVGYRIYFTTSNFTNATWIKLPVQEMVHILTELAPFSNYSISVKAFTRSVEGRESSPLSVTTDVSAPSAPHLHQLTCQSGAGLLVLWRRPAVYSRNIDYYVIAYRPEKEGAFTQLQITADTVKEECMFLLPNLTEGVRYEIRLRAATQSLLRPSQLRLSPYSGGLSATAQRRCRSIDGATSGVWRHLEHSMPLDVGTVAGIICACTAFLLALLALAIWRRYFQSSYLYLDEPVKTRVPLTSDPGWELDGPSGSAGGPIPAESFPLHVARLHADSEIGFCKEYDEILEHTMKVGLAAELSQAEHNKPLNRYQNITAYDHSLVRLRPVPGQNQPEYINANYIDGFLIRSQYIGTQAPLPSTFHAFWRMVWEQRVQILVMITNLMERNRKKCDMYWPKEGAEQYGLIQVELLDTRELATYTIRKLLIKHTKHKKRKDAPGERIIYQYHYTSWPDHGVPDHPLPIISFVRKSASANGAGAGPVLVHCSAGVGRTGTYIVLDAMMAMLKLRGTVNVFGFLKHVREQRNFLVQTEEQYVFVHDALLEALEAGETDVRATRLTDYLCQLRSHAHPAHLQYSLDRQYQLVTSFRPSEKELVAALSPCNRARNRGMQFVPLDRWRVHLAPKPGVEGSDYINATPLIGYEKQTEFIITQHPLHSTVADFWRMVWEHNVQTVVILSQLDGQHFPRFWPCPEEDMDWGGFRVLWVDEPAAGCCALVDLVLQSTQDDYQVTVRLVLSGGWPHAPVSVSPHQLVDLVQQATLKYQNGPLLVVDRFGGTEAATFCCVTSLSKQLTMENSVDVYLFAKLYHMRRPGIWATQADFELLYHTMEALVRPSLPRSPSSQYETEALMRPTETLVRPTDLRTVTVRVPPDGRECYVPAESV